MKNLVLETTIYEILKKEPKISSNELLNKTIIIYNRETGGTLKLDEYNSIMSKLKKYRYFQNYENHK